MLNVSKSFEHCHIDPFDETLWQGRDEPYETERARYWYQVVQSYRPHQPQAICIVGFACDQGVRRNFGRVGAKFAPAQIRQAFAKLPITRMLQSRFGIDFGYLLGDAGDVVCDDDGQLCTHALEQTQQHYAKVVSHAVSNQPLGMVIGLGGGHAIAYASFMGLWHGLMAGQDMVSRLPRIGIINFDAHFDLRQAPHGTSGTPFLQIAKHCDQHNYPFHYFVIGISEFSNSGALFDTADKLDVTYLFDHDCHRLTWDELKAQLNGFLAMVDVVYLTIDMDAFCASVVPGVSAPAAKGIPLDVAERCLTHIVNTDKVKMVDIAEINPTYDIDGRSAKVAARLVAHVLTTYLNIRRGAPLRLAEFLGKTQEEAKHANT